MKFLQILSLILLFIFTSCNGQSSNDFEKMAPKDFAEKIKSTDNPNILDVRTPEEFASEHLDNATNIDWNGEDFDKKATIYDKSKPVFVYCLSGGRSKKAASKLKELGFETVYELEGGILKWKTEGFLKPSTEQMGMTQDEFNKLLHSDKKILVDFYAEWCGPCKKMEPYLLKMQKEMSDKVTIIRIDVDKNKTLATQLKIDQLPIVILYENHEVKWKNIGFIREENLKKQLQ